MGAVTGLLTDALFGVVIVVMLRLALLLIIVLLVVVMLLIFREVLTALLVTSVLIGSGLVLPDTTSTVALGDPGAAVDVFVMGGGQKARAGLPTDLRLKEMVFRLGF